MFRKAKTGMLLAAAMGAALLGTAPALAWGKIGHRIGGTIAERHLSGQTRAKIALLLGTESLADASTWPDEMRANPLPFWQKTANPFHYVTVPGHEYGHHHAPAEGDAATALDRFSKVVRSRSASREEKQLALRFIVHIIGDLHQPLHAGKPGDRGGNDVKLSFFGRPTNLHAVWDSGIIDQEQYSSAEYSERLMRGTSNEEIVSWWEPNPTVWINESAELRDRIYPATSELSYDYLFQHRAEVERRLRQSGVRMAAYLDALFAEARPSFADNKSRTQVRASRRRPIPTKR